MVGNDDRLGPIRVILAAIFIAVVAGAGWGRASTMLCLAMVVFAIGATMLQPVGSTIVNDIAPEHLRGRYNAAAGLS